MSRRRRRRRHSMGGKWDACRLKPSRVLRAEPVANLERLTFAASEGEPNKWLRLAHLRANGGGLRAAQSYLGAPAQFSWNSSCWLQERMCASSERTEDDDATRQSCIEGCSS